MLHEKAFGYAQRYDYGKVERSEPVSMASNQIFDLASLTKVFSTTFGLMILVDEKKVDLEALVHTYLPYIPTSRISEEQTKTALRCGIFSRIAPDLPRGSRFTTTLIRRETLTLLFATYLLRVRLDRSGTIAIWALCSSVI